jgi:hypothetical protein
MLGSRFRNIEAKVRCCQQRLNSHLTLHHGFQLSSKWQLEVVTARTFYLEELRRITFKVSEDF